MNSLSLADDSNIFQKIIDAAISFGPYQLHWLEFIGVLIGVVSAWYGMRRNVWAWPVGILANIMLFFVYIGAMLGADERIPLFGQASRQVFFIITSIYGWWRWSQVKKRNAARSQDEQAPAVNPRWMTAKERTAIVAFWLVGTVVVHQVFVWLWSLAPNPYWQPQWWYFWCDAWIFIGSIVATYSMARGWNEFWLAWIAVDLVGVPLGFATGYVPTSVMYIFYGAFVIYGFTQWVKASREEQADPADRSDPPEPNGTTGPSMVDARG